MRKAVGCVGGPPLVAFMIVICGGAKVLLLLALNRRTTMSGVTSALRAEAGRSALSRRTIEGLDQSQEPQAPGLSAGAGSVLGVLPLWAISGHEGNKAIASSRVAGCVCNKT